MECDLVQGYYYAAPMEAEDATRVLAAAAAMPAAS
jgi:EAL domain-containing protein (putative c-di-GMP-specific phosphodiesterase class I)